MDWQASAGSRFPVGMHCMPVCGFHPGTRKMSVPFVTSPVGNTKQPPGSNKSTASRVQGAGSTRAGFAQVSRGSRGRGCLPRVSDMPSHSDRPCTLPCFAVAASAFPSAPFCSQLPVWPSTRFSWSLLSRMRKGGGFGKTRTRGGKRSSKDLSRGRPSCHHKRDDPRYGPGGTKSCRCSSAGDRH